MTEELTIEEVKSLYFLIQSGEAQANTTPENAGKMAFGEGKQTPEGGCIFPYVLTSKEEFRLQENFLSIAAKCIQQAEEIARLTNLVASIKTELRHYPLTSVIPIASLLVFISEQDSGTLNEPFVLRNDNDTAGKQEIIC